MEGFSIATGVTLLHDEGILPFNPALQAVAFASPAAQAKLGSDGLALKSTAVSLAMEDNAADGTVELSAAAMQFLVQDLASSESSAQKQHANQTAPQQSGYPYAGWSSVPDQNTSPAVSASSAVTSTPINLLA